MLKNIPHIKLVGGLESVLIAHRLHLQQNSAQVHQEILNLISLRKNLEHRTDDQEKLQFMSDELGQAEERLRTIGFDNHVLSSLECMQETCAILGHCESVQQKRDAQKQEQSSFMELHMQS